MKVSLSIAVLAALCGVAAWAAPASAQAGNTSAYTPIDLETCPLIGQVEEGASASWRCPGYRGIPVFVNTGDERMDVDAGVDNGDFETQPQFNDIGERVEWRLRQGRAFAIIFRLRLFSESRQDPRSVLVVETIGTRARPGCQIAVVSGNIPNANVVARQIADRRAPGFRCGTDQPETRAR